MKRTSATLAAAALGAYLARRSLKARLRRVTLDQRLAMLPETLSELDADLAIRWNEHHVPFVEAASDADLAAGFGLVHAHLRLAQMEIMRRAAHGRIAEVFGPAAVDLDHLLRLIDFPRAVAGSLAMMPQDSRRWIERYADGISAVCARTDVLPPEFRLLGVRPEPWTAADVVAVSRLCSADYAWKVWRTLYPLRGEPDWPRIWAELVSAVAVADEDVPPAVETLEETVPTAFARHGSNAAAVAAGRSASGSALIACDPHLMIATPCVWVIVGLAAPSCRLVGLTIPGVPIVGIGRNRDAGWGGTNLHATSSELVDVAAEEDRLTERTTAIRVRWGRTRTMKVRESRFGPVISDARPFHLEGNGPVALHWLGHRPSDEMTPFLKLMRVGSWEGFADALGEYGLPGLNMLYAGRDGCIGQMIAARVPLRPPQVPDDIVISPEAASAHWRAFVTGRDLPQTVDPDEGVVASANNAPPPADVAISHFYSADHRVDRLRALLASKPRLSADDLARFQHDVYFAPADALARRLVAAVPEAGAPSNGQGPLAALAAWDGRYAADSAGALAFELVSAALVETLEKQTDNRPAGADWRRFMRLARLVEGAPPETLRSALASALAAAERPFATYRTWGAMHRVRLAHPLGRVPWLRRIARLAEFGTGGSNETLLKTMHPFARRRHATHFGQNARFVADLADEDATDIVLLGGQDGWIGSGTAGDQVALWRQARFLRLPLGARAVAEAFPRLTKVRAVARARDAA